MRGWIGSIAVGGDDLAAVSGAQVPVGLEVDRALDASHGAVAQQEVAPAGVVARGVGVLPPREAPAAVAEPAAAPGVLLPVGRDDRVERGQPESTDRPAEALIVRT